MKATTNHTTRKALGWLSAKEWAEVQRQVERRCKAVDAAHARAIERYGAGTQALADWEDTNLRGPL